MLLLCVFALSTAFAQPPLQQLKGHVPDIVKNGQAPLVSILPSNQKMYLSIVLPIRNKPAFDQLLKELYNPKSPKYRQFLAPEQFAQQFSPAQSDYQKVLYFARANSFTVTNTPPNRLILSMEGTVAQAEQTFHVHMNLYRDRQAKRDFYAPDREPSISLSVPILHVAGLSNALIAKPMLGLGAGGGAYQSSGNPTVYYPYSMRAAYYGGSSLTGSGQCLALGEFQGYNIEDVIQTLQAGGRAQASYITTGSGNYVVSYTPPGSSSSYSVTLSNVPLDGGTVAPYLPQQNPPNEDIVQVAQTDEEEVVADISQAIGMAPGMSQIEIYLVPFQSFDYAGDILNAMMDPSPYGIPVCSQSAMPWAQWSPGYYGYQSTYLDQAFQSLEQNGQSLFVSTGDAGSWPINGYYDYFPADDPYVIAVGGTVLTTNSSGGWSSESAWSSGGGGISPDNLPLLPYQNGVETSCNHASTTLRSAPDIAMESSNDNYTCGAATPYPSCTTMGYGTSFAAVRWAAFMALVNQQATQDGMAPGSSIGNIDPIVYTMGFSSTYQQNMHDITSGSNGAYNACPGYDLVTGWGSPNGQNTINALVNTTPNAPLPAADPYEYNVNVTLQGTAPPTSITATMYLGDATPGATIYYQVSICGEPYALTSVQPGTYLQFVNYCPSMPASGYMYAVAPKYGQSQTVSMSF
uniref:Peptidase S53 domain-containing protein n=1 Tax=mine drainage metagenome TaxID=410659 RepID=E6QN21_9ZZZZ